MKKNINTIFILFLGSVFTVAQIKTEEIIIQNIAIQLPGIFSYSSKKSTLAIWAHHIGALNIKGNKVNYIGQLRTPVNIKSYSNADFKLKKEFLQTVVSFIKNKHV